MITFVLIRVVYEENGDVNVRPFLFGDMEKAVPGKSADRVGAPNPLFLEFSQDNIHLGQCPQCSQVDLLIRPRGTINQSSEIVDLVDVVVRAEKLKKSLQIQPLAVSAPNRPVIEVEAINVNNGLIRHVQRGNKKEGQSYRLPKPALVCRGVVQRQALFLDDRVKGIIEFLSLPTHHRCSHAHVEGHPTTDERPGPKTKVWGTRFSPEENSVSIHGYGTFNLVGNCRFWFSVRAVAEFWH